MSMLEMLASMFDDGLLGQFFAIAIILAVLIAVGLILWGIYIVINLWFRPLKKGYGTVISKQFTPAHTQTVLVYNAATKTPLPTPIFHPDDWSVTIRSIEGAVDSISISEDFFNKLKEKEMVKIEYVTGRLSGGFYLKTIQQKIE